MPAKECPPKSYKSLFDNEFQKAKSQGIEKMLQRMAVFSFFETLESKRKM